MNVTDFVSLSCSILRLSVETQNRISVNKIYSSLLALQKISQKLLIHLTELRSRIVLQHRNGDFLISYKCVAGNILQYNYKKYIRMFIIFNYQYFHILKTNKKRLNRLCNNFLQNGSLPKENR